MAATSTTSKAETFIAQDQKLLIDGQWVLAEEGATLDTVNPSTAKQLGRVAAGSERDVALAVGAARRAFDEGPWRSLPRSERARLLFALADAIDQHADEIAMIDTLDSGKPYSFIRDVDLPNMSDLLRYMAGWSTKLEGRTIPLSRQVTDDFLSYTRREPVGVAAQIIPWNGSALAAVWKLAPALAAGCTVVLKPAEQASFAPVRIGELVCEAGFPDGVVNIITGHGTVAGASLAAHPSVDKIAFTGSADTGKRIVQAASSHLGRLTLELGGKSPVIVCADADLDAAIDGAVAAVLFAQGQSCTAGSRLFIDERVYDDVVAGVVDRATKLEVGPSRDRDVVVGPMITDAARTRVAGIVETAIADGAELLCGGKNSDSDGFFLQPTVLAGTRDDMAVMHTEVFGPVVNAIPFSDVDDAVRRANDTRYGLAAGVWTRDISTAHRVAGSMRAGAVFVNGYNVFDAALPFGGVKESGWGKEMGGEALDSYLQTTAITVTL